jgi:peptidoglycan hydrolase-like protein with peptidoglycan-binding domain
MKTGLFCFLIAVFAGSLALSQTAAAPATTKKKSTSGKSASVKSTSVKKKKTATTASAKKKTSARKKAVPAGPPRQLAPTPERYREIQQALADKGYLKSEPNGVWDDQSAEALKQFQTDKHLSPTGKISALSLINLGLGPKTPEAPAVVPGAPALEGSHPPATEPGDLPPPPETLPPPAN